MQSNSLEKFYLSGVRWVLYVIPFLPLYISSSILFPYITGRNFAFRILVEAALVLWIGLVALNREYLPRLSPVLKALLVFITVVFIADIFGANLYRSFWSNYERMEGFLMLAHLGVFFILATSVFRAKEWRIFGNLIIISSIGVILYAILQKFGVYTSIQGGVRVDGTIGNPAYLAAYLLLCFTVTSLYFFGAAARGWKYFYGVIGILQLLVIYFSATRGAILGFFAGLVIFSILALLFSSRSDSSLQGFRKVAWAILGLMVAVPILFWMVKDSPYVLQSPVLSRFATISLTERTTQSRLIIWGMAWQGIKENPVLGWGQENFNLIFNKYYDSRLWAQEPWFDRSHNIVFDWLSNAGFLGLVAYLSLFGTAFYGIWKVYRMNGIDIGIASAFIAGLSAYFLQNLFVFDNFNSYFIFFSLLGYSHFLWTEAALAETAQKSLVKDPSRSVTAAAIFTVVFLVLGYILHIRPILEGRALIAALQAANAGERPDSVLVKFQKAFSYRTFGDREAMEQFAQYGGRVADAEQLPAEERLKVVGASISELERQAARFPEDIRFRLFLASLGYLKAVQLDSSYFPKAEQEFKRVIEQSPTKHQPYFGLIQLYLAVGQLDKVFPLAEKAYAMDPAYPEAQLFYVASAVYGGRLDIAEKGLFNHANLFYPPQIVHIINAYDITKKTPALIPILRKKITEEPEIAQHHASLASVYARLNDRERAIAEAREAGRLDPETFGKEVEEFIKALQRR